MVNQAVDQGVELSRDAGLVEGSGKTLLMLTQGDSDEVIVSVATIVIAGGEFQKDFELWKKER